MKNNTLSRHRARSAGFTLVELLPAMTIAIILIVLLAKMVQLASFAWTHGDDQAETFTEGRAAVDLLSRDIQGAVVNLDFGFRLRSVAAGGAASSGTNNHNYCLTFLTNCAPNSSGTNNASTSGTSNAASSVMKVCYQLGWADTTLFPKIQATYTADYPIPVLVRTASTYMDDVFTVTGTDPGNWANTFASLAAGPLETGTLHTIDDPEGVSEVICENVLGMEIHPLFWDTTLTPPLQVSYPGTSDTNSQTFYNDYLTSVNGPRALAVQIAMVPTRSIGVLSHLTGWPDVFTQEDLFDILTPPNTSKLDTFHSQLRQNIRYFSSTVYLQSKTP